MVSISYIVKYESLSFCLQNWFDGNIEKPGLNKWEESKKPMGGDSDLFITV